MAGGLRKLRALSNHLKMSDAIMACYWPLFRITFGPQSFYQYYNQESESHSTRASEFKGVICVCQSS